jgi:hypothetical protein
MNCNNGIHHSFSCTLSVLSTAYSLECVFAGRLHVFGRVNCRHAFCGRHKAAYGGTDRKATTKTLLVYLLVDEMGSKPDMLRAMANAKGCYVRHNVPVKAHINASHGARKQ